MNEPRALKNERFLLISVSNPLGGAMLNIRLPLWGLAVLGLAVVGVLALVLGSTSMVVGTSVKLLEYRQLKATSVRQQREIRAYNSQLDSLKDMMGQLMERELEIRTLLGEVPSGPQSLVSPETRSRSLQSKQAGLSYQSKFVALYQIHHQNERNMVNLQRRVHQLKARFAVTPSMWPIYGSIASGFGWRIHPVTGQRAFHTGVDIPSWIGCPVKVTADGVVRETGWDGGYGKVVIVDHGFGYSTVYAHLSRSLVRNRQTVKKGQVIAEVGSTGISTGPHLHYEVLRWQQMVSPTPYLNLTVLTAAKQY